MVVALELTTVMVVAVVVVVAAAVVVVAVVAVVVAVPPAERLLSSRSLASMISSCTKSHISALFWGSRLQTGRF